MRELLSSDPNAPGSGVDPTIAQGYVDTGNGQYEYEPGGNTQTQVTDTLITRAAAVASAPAANPAPAPVSVPSFIDSNGSGAPLSVVEQGVQALQDAGNTITGISNSGGNTFVDASAPAPASSGNGTGSDTTATTGATTGASGGTDATEETNEQRLLDLFGAMFQGAGTGDTSQSLAPEIAEPDTPDASTADTATTSGITTTGVVGLLVVLAVLAWIGYYFWKRRKAGGST